MRSRAAFALAVGALVSCGGPAGIGPRPPEAHAIEEAAGVRLLALPRATPGRVWLSAWVDAGARDASPAQLAAIAAWAVAPDGVEARALSDGIELSRPCEAAQEALTECLRSLGSALETRRVEPAALEAAIARARQARRRVTSDVSRTADAVALEALLGAGGDPLGDATADDAVDAARVEAFLADHFGPSRALIVAVGDVRSDVLRAAAARAFAALPAARLGRADRPAPAEGVGVRVGDRPVLAVATAFESVGVAIAAAHRLRARVGDELTADVFPVRGATVLVARADRADPAELIDGVRELHEESGAEVAPPSPEDPRALARWFGARWVSGQGGRAGGLGVGAVVEGGRADRFVDDPDTALRQRARESLSAALSARPGVEGAVGPDRADVRLANGARIMAVRLASTENVAVTALFEGGAREETARSHGITALLAVASARECRARAASELGAPPEALGISVRPHVGTERFGLSVTGPRARWPEVTYLAGRCARGRDLDAATVEGARAEPWSAAALAALAHAISPEAPGRIVASPSEATAAGRDEVARWRDRVAGGARARFGLAGDVPIEAATRRLARIVSRYPEGEAATADRWTGPPSRLSAGAGDRVGAWIVWSTPAEAVTRGAVGQFCEAAARAIDDAGSLRVVGRHHGMVGGRALAAVLVEADEATLSGLPGHVPAIPSVDLRALDAPPAADAPTSRALALALDEPTASLEAARASFESLRTSTPTFVVVRPPR